MKTLRKMAVLALMSFAALSSLAQKDADLITAIIEKETSSFYGVNYDYWQETWLKAPYVYWSFADSTGVSFLDGWEEINSAFQDYFKTSSPSKAKIEREWKEIRVYGTGAFVRFIQKVSDELDRGYTSETRVLEKIDGKWKIICVDVTAIQPAKQSN